MKINSLQLVNDIIDESPQIQVGKGIGSFPPTAPTIDKIKYYPSGDIEYHYDFPIYVVHTNDGRIRILPAHEYIAEGYDD